MFSPLLRFADVFGLDLADVKTFLDEVPRVPKSAFRDLKDAKLSDIESDSGSELHCSAHSPAGLSSFSLWPCRSAPTLAPLFTQPCSTPRFFTLLRDQKVCLESACVSDLKTIKGTVRVINLDFNKRVVVRYTSDNWQTSSEVDAAYLNGSCDGFSDKFTFSIDYSSIAGSVGKRLQFCLKFECAGNVYWDNNGGNNFIFQSFGPSPLSSTFGRPSWRRRVPVVTPPVAVSTTAQSSASGQCAFLSQSPAMLDDPWHRYL